MIDIGNVEKPIKSLYDIVQPSHNAGSKRPANAKGEK